MTEAGSHQSPKENRINPLSSENNSLRQLLHQQNTYIWAWHKNSYHIDVDQHFREKLGLEKENEQLAQHLYQILHSSDKIKWLRFIVNLRYERPIIPFEIRFRHAAGNHIWFRITTENPATPATRMGLLLDITKDKNALAITQDKNARLEASIQNNFGLNIIIDQDLNVKHIHNGRLILKENTENVFKKLTIDSFFDKESRTIFFESLDEILRTPDAEIKTEVTTNPLYTREPRHLEIIIVNKLKDPRVQGIVIDARDISDHKSLEVRLKKQRQEYLNLYEEFEAQNKKINIKNEILEAKNQEIAETIDKLSQSENRFLSLSKIVNESITVIENKNTVFISDRLAQITGYPIEELYGIDIKHLAAAKENLTPRYPNPDNKNIYEINFWVFTKNGEKRYLSNIFYREQKSGKPTYTFIITTDQTQQKIQTELLRDNQMKLKATLESLQKWIIVVDNKGFIINFYKPTNTSYFLLKKGFDPTGKHYTELPLPEQFIEKILDTGIKVQKDGIAQAIEIPIELKRKIRWYYVNISIRYSTTGQNIGWTLVLDDITRIKATEMELKNRETQLYSLINHFPDIVCLKDRENRWILANKPLLELYGIKNQPYLLKTCKELATIHPENKSIYTKCAETDVIAWHTRKQYKYDMIFDQGRELPRAYEIIKVPIFDNQGEPAWLIMLGRDVTKRKHMTQELKIAKENAEMADQLKTAFLTNMSHELRTPLNAIVGFSQLLSQPSTKQDEREEFIKIIIESSNYLLNIINDIIDLSKMETGQLNLNINPVNIKEMLLDSFNYYKNHYTKANLNFEIEFPDTPYQIIIDTDKVRLQQVLNSLVANAFKFTKSGTIKINVGFDQNHEFLHIKIKDTGIGIDPKYHKTIFERFRQVEEGYTREYGGAGLGLAISKKLTEMLGGKINLESIPGSGSEFTIKLPYIRTPKRAENDKAPADISFIKNKSVLAVEDDAGSYLLLKSILRNTGCRLIHAKNGKEALELIKKQSNIDLVLMDVQMPVMDGLEATQKIKALHKNIPIIAQTAHAFSNDRQKCIDAGCDDFITKPVRFEELFLAISKTIKPDNLN